MWQNGFWICDSCLSLFLIIRIVTWIRKGKLFGRDEWIDIKRPVGAFDSEMICYGKLYRNKERLYLFYSGNHFGMDGIGWAEYEE